MGGGNMWAGSSSACMSFGLSVSFSWNSLEGRTSDGGGSFSS